MDTQNCRGTPDGRLGKAFEKNILRVMEKKAVLAEQAKGVFWREAGGKIGSDL